MADAHDFDPGEGITDPLKSVDWARLALYTNYSLDSIQNSNELLERLFLHSQRLHQESITALHELAKAHEQVELHEDEPIDMYTVPFMAGAVLALSSIDGLAADHDVDPVDYRNAWLNSPAFLPLVGLDTEDFSFQEQQEIVGQVVFEVAEHRMGQLEIPCYGLLGQYVDRLLKDGIIGNEQVPSLNRGFAYVHIGAREGIRHILGKGSIVETSLEFESSGYNEETPDTESGEMIVEHVRQLDILRATNTVLRKLLGEISVALAVEKLENAQQDFDAQTFMSLLGISEHLTPLSDQAEYNDKESPQQYSFRCGLVVALETIDALCNVASIDRKMFRAGWRERGRVMLSDVFQQENITYVEQLELHRADVLHRGQALLAAQDPAIVEMIDRISERFEHVAGQSDIFKAAYGLVVGNAVKVLQQIIGERAATAMMKDLDINTVVYQLLGNEGAGDG